jgi:hypothetical protein
MGWKQLRCPVGSIGEGGQRHRLSLSNGHLFNDSIFAGLNDVGQGAQSFVGDFNGDGRADLLFAWMDSSGTFHDTVALSNGSGFQPPSDWLLNQGQGAQIFVGDFNGDGKADLLFSWTDSSGTFHNSVALSDGSSFRDATDWLLNQGQGAQIFVGDFNGDGKADLLFSWMDSSGTFHNSVALSDGSSFHPATDWLLNQGQGAKISVGDFNGDGKADLLFSWMDSSGTFHNSVALSNGGSFRDATDWLLNQGQGAQISVGDFNGDGKADLLFAWTDSSGTFHNSVALSTGGSFQPAADWLLNQGQGTHYSLGDFNGDHTTDLLFSYAADQISVQNPCWTNANQPGVAMQQGLNWIENAYELLNTPGQWYLDKTENLIFYIPLPGEDMSTAKVVAPRLEQLIQGVATQNIRFTGIAFAYATWLEPNTAAGYPEIQAGILEPSEEKTLAQISFSGSSNITFSANQFLHLGGVALGFGGGSQSITIGGNTFSDISGGAIMFGDVTDAAQTNPLLQNANVTLSNNYITQTGVEYEDSVPIFLGYVTHATVEQNEIAGSNYSGISVGWGWSTNATYASNNSISQNWIHDVMQTLMDGGGVYTLSSQPNSSLTGNLIERIGPTATCSYSTPGYLGYVGIYHDNGTQFYTDSGNVIRESCGYWLLLQGGWSSSTADTYSTILNGNYVDVDHTWCNGGADSSTSCDFNGNAVTNLSVLGASSPPAGIISAAGISAPYLYTKSVLSGALY